MSTWILILTLGMGDYRAGFAIESVPGFKTEASCMAAAESWLKQVAGKSDDGTRYWRPRAICIQQS